MASRRKASASARLAPASAKDKAAGSVVSGAAAMSSDMAHPCGNFQERGGGKTGRACRQRRRRTKPDACSTLHPGPHRELCANSDTSG
jgi:hypothetical protein